MRTGTFAIALLVVSLAACGGNGADSDLGGDSQVATDLGTPDTPPQDDTFVPTELPPVDDVAPELPPVEDVVPELPPVEDVTPELPPVEDVVPELPPVEDVVPELPPVEDVTPDNPPPPECDADDDCVSDVEPEACHRWACDLVEGKCVQAHVDNGTACSDGEFCTGPDTCQDGTCVAGPAVTCDDGDLCTADTCTFSGCQNVPDTTVLTCGTGACYREIARCSEGVLHECVPGLPLEEACDGIDNNCDGQVDEGNPGGGGACVTDLPGPCAPGTAVCENAGIVCKQNVQAQAEKCDRIDNNCNGQVDEDAPSSGLPCKTTKLGVCEFGETACLNGYVVCDQTVFPSAELCDGMDNDCNGVVDNDSPGSGLPCATGKPGVCNEGVTVCAEGKIACSQVGIAVPEICDGVDNDCDGLIDPANATGCLNFLRDEDGDGFGVLGDVQCLCAPTGVYTVPVAGDNRADCCDIDPRAFPGATPWVTTLSACGSFDFNCDGGIAQQYTYGTGSCGWWPLCATTRGWLGATPKCGEPGQVLTDCNFNGFNCSQTTSNVTLGCN